jgi:hypothetical protein
MTMIGARVPALLATALAIGAAWELLAAVRAIIAAGALPSVLLTSDGHRDRTLTLALLLPASAAIASRWTDDIGSQVGPDRGRLLLTLGAAVVTALFTLAFARRARDVSDLLAIGAPAEIPTAIARPRATQEP